MGKYGVNVPKGVVCSTVDDVKKATQSLFAGKSEVISIGLLNLQQQYSYLSLDNVLGTKQSYEWYKACEICLILSLLNMTLNDSWAEYHYYAQLTAYPIFIFS